MGSTLGSTLATKKVYFPITIASTQCFGQQCHAELRDICYRLDNPEGVEEHSVIPCNQFLKNFVDKVVSMHFNLKSKLIVGSIIPAVFAWIVQPENLCKILSAVRLACWTDANPSLLDEPEGNRPSGCWRLSVPALECVLLALKEEAWCSTQDKENLLPVQFQCWI